MSAYLLLSSFVDNSTRTVDIGVEGTLDWCHVADLAVDDFKKIDNGLAACKRDSPGWLLKGFDWRTTGALSNITQTVQRTLTASNPQGAINANFNSSSSTNKCGWFQLSSTAQVGMGYRMVLAAPTWRKLRLKCYSTNFRANQRATAWLRDGITDEVASQFIDLPSNGTNNMEEWTVDFQGGTERSIMIFECVCFSQDASLNTNMGVQGFTLQVIP